MASLAAILVAIVPLANAYPGGAGTSLQQYDCGSSCHVTPSLLSISMSTRNLTVAPGESVTVNVTVMGPQSGNILGVMIISHLSPVPASLPSAAGWTITADPGGSGSNNYFEIANYSGAVTLQWSLTAPSIEGNYTLFARAHHGWGGNPSYIDNTTGLTFVVKSTSVIAPITPIITISTPSNQASVEGTIWVNASIQANKTIANATLRIDGVIINTTTAPPFHWIINTTGYTNGQHTINITAYDIDGNVGHNEITINVDNPIVEVPAPTAIPFGLVLAAGGLAVLALIGVTLLIMNRKKGAPISEIKEELTENDKELLAPILRTRRSGYLLLALTLVGVALFFGMWYHQMNQGLGVTGMRDYGVPLQGSPWGIYIVNFIWFVGIAHGGIVMSAAIRVMKLKKYQSIARMAELLTIVTLLMAGLSIVMDMGRPDRLFEMIIYYADRISTSPLVWDITVIIIYITLSMTYLYLLMREDLAYLRNRMPKFRWLYSLLLFSYRKDEKAKIDQIAWWIALTLLVIVFLLSGGVIPWLFGLIAAQAGWFGAIQGPMYLTAALASALAAVIVMVAVMRKTFRWEKRIDADIFRGMGTALSVLVIIYLWFTLHEQLTYQYAAPSSEYDISNSLLFGQYAPIFWSVIAMLLGSFAYLAGSAIAKRFNLLGTIAASSIVLLAFWVKRFLIIIPSLTQPRLDLYPGGVYIPTYVEYSLVIGTIAITLFLIFLFIKIFPVMEVKVENDVEKAKVEEEIEPERKPADASRGG